MATFKDKTTSTILRPLQDLREYVNPQGINLQLCVLHELNLEGTYSVQAIGVFNGFSVCREHLIRLYNSLDGGN